MKALRKFFSSLIVRLLLGLIVGGTAFWLALREVDLDALAGSWPLVDKGLAAAALLLAIGTNLGKAARWRLLLSAGRPAPGFWKTLRLYFAGQLANILIPGRLGDFGRAFGVGGRGTGTTYALGTVVIEKGFDALLFAFFTGLLLAFGPLPAWMQRPAYVLLALGIVVGLAGWWLFRRKQVFERFFDRLTARLPEKFRERVRVHMAAGLSSLEVFRGRGDLGRFLLWTAWIWGSSLLVNLVTLMAFRLFLPFTASMMLMVVLQIGFSVLLTPAAIGVFEYLCVLVLSVYGVSQTGSFGFAVLLHAVVLAPLIIGGSAALVSLGAGSQASTAGKTHTG